MSLKKHEDKYLHIPKNVIYSIPFYWLCWVGVWYLYNHLPVKAPTEWWITIPVIISLLILVVIPIGATIYFYVEE